MFDTFHTLNKSFVLRSRFNWIKSNQHEASVQCLKLKLAIGSQFSYINNAIIDDEQRVFFLRQNCRIWLIKVQTISSESSTSIAFDDGRISWEKSQSQVKIFWVMVKSASANRFTYAIWKMQRRLPFLMNVRIASI